MISAVVMMEARIFIMAKIERLGTQIENSAGRGKIEWREGWVVLPKDEKADSSLRAPTRSQERMGKKKRAHFARNDSVWLPDDWMTA